MYAVNIGDMLKPEAMSLPVQMLILPVRSQQIVNAEPGNMDGSAFVMSCDDERGQAIVDILRKKIERHELRCYYSSTGNSWKRV